MRAVLLLGAAVSTWYCFNAAAQLAAVTLAPEPGLDAPGLISFPVALSGYLALVLVRSVPSGHAPWPGWVTFLRGFGKAWLLGVTLLFVSGTFGEYLRAGSVRLKNLEDLFFNAVVFVLFAIPALAAFAVAHWADAGRRRGGAKEGE